MEEEKKKDKERQQRNVSIQNFKWWTGGVEKCEFLGVDKNNPCKLPGS